MIEDLSDKQERIMFSECVPIISKIMHNYDQVVNDMNLLKNDIFIEFKEDIEEQLSNTIQSEMIRNDDRWENIQQNLNLIRKSLNMIIKQLNAEKEHRLNNNARLSKIEETLGISNPYSLNSSADSISIGELPRLSKTSEHEKLGIVRKEHISNLGSETEINTESENVIDIEEFFEKREILQKEKVHNLIPKSEVESESESESESDSDSDLDSELDLESEKVKTASDLEDENIDYNKKIIRPKLNIKEASKIVWSVLKLKRLVHQWYLGTKSTHNYPIRRVMKDHPSLLTRNEQRYRRVIMIMENVTTKLGLPNNVRVYIEHIVPIIDSYMIKTNKSTYKLGDTKIKDLENVENEIVAYARRMKKKRGG